MENRMHPAQVLLRAAGGLEDWSGCLYYSLKTLSQVFAVAVGLTGALVCPRPLKEINARY